MQSKGSNHDTPKTKARFEQSAINYTPSQFATSYAGSMANAHGNRDDDMQTKVSIYSSYTEAAMNREDGRVKKEAGRHFNVLSDTYSLPTEEDLDEWDRLDKQHRGIVLGLGGLYPTPEVVRAVLAPEEGVTKRIVDLGCGTGIWTTEMAREFPHCELLGVDLAPVPLPAESLPSNCRFEMDDISLGLSHLHGQFHVVFARLIALGLKDFRRSLSDAVACAKPGGIVIWIDGDYALYSGWPMVYRAPFSNADPSGSYASRVVYEVRRIGMSLLRSDVATMEKILDEGFRTHAPELDPDTCKSASLYLPVGLWCHAGAHPAQNELLKYVGTLMRQDISEGSKSVSPLLLKAGWSKETVDRWTEGMRAECQNGNLGARFRIAWGRRREAANLPAPALPKVPVTPEEEVQQMVKYPLYEVYDTPEQASAAAEIRNRGKADIVLPTATQSGE